MQKLLASYRLQGVPDDLTQLQHPWFTRWWRFSCHVAGLVMDVSAVWAFIYTRSCKSCLQATVCKGFPMTLHSFSCYVAGLVLDVSAVWAFTYTRSCKSCLQASVCKGFPMTLHSCSIPGSPAGGDCLATLPVLSWMSVQYGLLYTRGLAKAACKLPFARGSR